MSKRVEDWGGPDYLRSYTASRRLAEKIKQYYRHSSLYDSIKVNVTYNYGNNTYNIDSNISELMESVTDAENRAGV